MPLACNARRRASMMPKVGGGPQPGSSSYESMMDAAGGAGPMEQQQVQHNPAPAPSTRTSSKSQHRIGVSPYGAAARLDMEGGMTPAERKAALLKKRQSLAVMSRFSHTGGRGISYSGLSSSAEPNSSSNEENQPPAAAAPTGGRGALKPRPTGVNVVPAAVTTNIVKPTTGIYAAAEQQQGQAQPQQLDAKQASMLLKQLRATVGRAEQAGKRLQVLAQAQRGNGGIRPSQEVLSLASRLQAANTAALDALGTLFPPELFPIPSEEDAPVAAAEPEQQEQQPQEQEGGDKEAASLLSVVAEEGEGEEQEGEGQEVEAALKEMVEEVEAQLSQLDSAAEAPAVEGAAEEQQAPASQEEQDEEGTVAIEEEQEAAAEPEHAAVGGPDSPPSMSDLGLSAFTRRFILEGAKPSSSPAAAGTKPLAAGAGVKGLSPTFSASPASPPLPIEKRAAEAMGVLPPGTPVITMPTADGERAFPSPVFRTGVKLRHPPGSEAGARGGAHHDAHAPHSAGSSTSTNSSSLPSPALFEPKSVDRHGARHSLHAPGQQLPQQTHHPFLTTTNKPPPGSVLKQHDASFASSSAPTPGLASPALRRTRLQHQIVAATAAAAGTDGSDDPTPALATAAGNSETPSTTRCIRLLQFPPSGGAGARTSAGAAPATGGSGSATRAKKAIGRTPLAGQDPNESMTYNYPDLTTHSTSFCFSPKGLGLEAEPLNNNSSTPPQPQPSAASSSGRYLLRSAEKKARELALAKQREEEAAAVPTPSRQRVVSASGIVSAGGGSARRSPRLAARSQALAAANRRVSMTGGAVPPSPAASATRKSPRVAAKAGAGSKLFGEEDEVEGGVVPIAEVGEAEYGKTPSFIRIQVTRDMLNGAIAAINAHVAAAGPQLEPLERVLEVVAQGDASKTLLLSLVHLKRVEIVVDARGQKAYKLWR